MSWEFSWNLERSDCNFGLLSVLIIDNIPDPGNDLQIFLYCHKKGKLTAVNVLHLGH